jgi:hypothetical protein
LEHLAVALRLTVEQENQLQGPLTGPFHFLDITLLARHCAEFVWVQNGNAIPVQSGKLNLSLETSLTCNVD